MNTILRALAVPVMAAGIVIGGLAGSASATPATYSENVFPSNAGAHELFSIDPGSCATQITGTDCAAIEFEGCYINGVVTNRTIDGVFWEDSNFFSSNANGSSEQLCGSYPPFG